MEPTEYFFNVIKFQFQITLNPYFYSTDILCGRKSIDFIDRLRAKKILSKRIHKRKKQEERYTYLKTLNIDDDI